MAPPEKTKEEKRQDLIKARYLWHRSYGYTGAQSAMRAARAEQSAIDLGLIVDWEWDDCADLGDHEYWCTAAKQGKCKGHEVEQVSIKTGREYIASLGGIIEPTSDYRRVIEADLFQVVVEVLAQRYADQPSITFADIK